jgi:hypothetical protein
MSAPPRQYRHRGAAILGLTVALVLVAPTSFADPAAPAPSIAPPQIVVQAAPPVVTVNLPRPNPFQTWLPVGVAILSAMVAATSLYFARQSQVFSFRKDAAAIKREFLAKRAAISQQAFENNVARPVGMVLDTVERLVDQTMKLRPLDDAAKLPADIQLRGADLMSDHVTCVRLSREADNALHDGEARRVFRSAYMAARLDTVLLDAILSALDPGKPSGDTLETAIDTVVKLKVQLRTILETERLAEVTRWIGDVTNDPFYPELRKWLGA